MHGTREVNMTAMTVAVAPTRAQCVEGAATKADASTTWSVDTLTLCFYITSNSLMKKNFKT